MNNFEFLNYTATPAEKHLGVATVKAYGRIILRYKIVPTKDGSGYFPAAPSLKVTDENGTDCYVSGFLVDSNSENEMLMSLIKANVKKLMASVRTPSTAPLAPQLAPWASPPPEPPQTPDFPGLYDNQAGEPPF